MVLGKSIVSPEGKFLFKLYIYINMYLQTDMHYK